MIRTKQGFLLRRLGNEYMVVPIGKASEKLNGMIRMNETGAFYWKELERGITEDGLVEKMLERFDDLDEETARRDLKEYLQTMEIALEFEDGKSNDRAGA